MRISVIEVDANRRPTLLLSGLESGRYGLESSTNLVNWVRLVSGDAANGTFRYQHAEAPQVGGLYYRGIRMPETVAIMPQLDSNRVAVAVITPEAGGQLNLADAGGTRFRFTVGPSNVLEPVAITMQLITNFAAFPTENALRSAVLFKPDGFTFHGAGVLEIQYPTNIPTLKISSFGFGGDGAGFHLTPDLVSSNQVRIPVTHFSGVGTGLWEPTERTRAVTQSIESNRDRLAHELGTILSRERDRQLLGQTEQTSVAAEFALREREYYERYLKPFFAEARGDCALAQFLTRELLGLERTRNLLGDEGGTSFLYSDEFKAWTCNCQKEAIQACTDGKITDKTLIQALLGFERQAQLVGSADALGDCGLGSINEFLDQAMARKLPCVPEWFGWVSYSDGGSRTWSCSSSYECRVTSSAALSFRADVEKVVLEDQSVPPFFSMQTWRLTILPQATGAFSSDLFSHEKYPCGGTYTKTDRANGATSGPMEIQAEFTFLNGQLTQFYIGDKKTLAVATDVVVTTTSTGCPGESDSGGDSSTYVSRSTVYLSPASATLAKATFTKRSPTELEGTVQGTRSGIDGIEMPYQWGFSLRRKSAGN